MTKRLYHLGLNTAADSWRTIRNLRADPDNPLRKRMTPERALVFQTALEQAQQQFTAAASVGYESRPLNLFYGLSQAGRAIAAASSHLGDGSAAAGEWVGNGHGLSFRPELLPGVNLLSSSVSIAKKRSSKTLVDLFSRVSIALGSPHTPGSIPLLQILAQLPEYRFEFEDNEPWAEELHPTGIYAGAPFGEGPLNFEVLLPGLDPSSETTEAEVLDAAAIYPALRGFAVAHNVDGSILLTSTPPQVALRVPLDQLRLKTGGSYMIPVGAKLYRRSDILFPAIGTSGEALHPLMSWWLILYSLSMTARYAPADWTGALALGSSPIASKVEHILDVSLEVVPDLIAESLTHLE